MKASAAILGVVIVGLAVFAVVAGTSLGTDKGTAFNESIADAKDPKTAQIQIRPSNSLIKWSGSIFENGDSTSYEGIGHKDIAIDCSQGMGIYSLAIQYMGEHGILTVNVVQDGNVIDTGTTSAAYGVVSLSGTCN